MAGLTYLAAITVIAVVLIAGHAAGHHPAIPLEQVADVIVIIKPRERQSLNLPATVDRMIVGDIVRIEKGVSPIVIVHTRNTFTAPIEAGVPVRLYLKAFKDGHAHYIIGVSTEPVKSEP
ncbi:MAG TPA: hypothetical protein VK548_03705 [Candidatus Acidoferrum sp.]|nr:hypothetical protein [Candidatus Acidoferrum sp.]